MPCTASWTWFALVGHWMLNNCSYLPQQNQCCALYVFVCLFVWEYTVTSGHPGNQHLLESSESEQDIILNYKHTFLYMWKCAGRTKRIMFFRQATGSNCCISVNAFHAVFMHLLDKIPYNRNGKAKILRTGNWFLYRCHSKSIQIQIAMIDWLSH